MKKFMKFAAMAAAVLSLCVACQKDNEETPTLEGKQWVCEWVDWTEELIPAVVDFGVTVEGKCVLASEWNGVMEENVVPPCAYKIEPTDATSGVITLTIDWGDGVIGIEKYSYSNLTKTSVTFGPIQTPGPVEETKDKLFDPTFTINYEKPATLATSKIDINILTTEE